MHFHAVTMANSFLRGIYGHVGVFRNAICAGYDVTIRSLNVARMFTKIESRTNSPPRRSWRKTIRKPAIPASRQSGQPRGPTLSDMSAIRIPPCRTRKRHGASIPHSVTESALGMLYDADVESNDRHAFERNEHAFRHPSRIPRSLPILQKIRCRC